MSSIWVEGNQRIQGEITVQGCKNAVLPMMAVSLLTEDEVCIENCPSITDVEVMAQLLGLAGVHVTLRDGILRMQKKQDRGDVLFLDRADQLRASGILLGALAANGYRAVLKKPGGCTIGARPMDLHMQAFRALGYAVLETEDFIRIERTDGAHAAKIRFAYPSVGATENAMLASVLIPGRTEIIGAAREPEIVDLAGLLKSMGAVIEGAGEDCIRILGVRELTGTSYRVMPDRIVAGTYLLGAAMTGGELFLHDVCPAHLGALLYALRRMGCRSAERDRGLYLYPNGRLLPGSIRTGPHPRYPTDLQAPMMAAMAVSDGTSVIRETVFESRFATAAELVKMGAEICTAGSEAIIRGKASLHGSLLDAPDLRGGAALLMAACAAEGSSVVRGAEKIARGYEDIVRDMRRMGIRCRYLE